MKSLLMLTMAATIGVPISFPAHGDGNQQQQAQTPLTHVPVVPAVQPKPANLQTAKPPEIPDVPSVEIPADVRRSSRAPPMEPSLQPKPVYPPPETRGPDHLLERGPDAAPAGLDTIRESAVSQLFENALRAHPGEFEEAGAGESVFSLDLEPGEVLFTPGESGSRIPGGQSREIPGYSHGEQGFVAPEGMPPSPVPDRSGQGPARLVVPPSANLRDAASGSASTVTVGSIETSTGGGVSIGPIETEVERSGVQIEVESIETEVAPSRVEIGPVKSEVAPAPEKEIPKEDLTQLQDGDADPTGGSGVNPVTGLSTRPPKQNPDQVNPGPDGAVVLPSGARLRPRDLEVNPDPHQHRGGHDPAATLRRMESPDQVDPPPVGPAGAEAP
ncbi:MAG: hypothetical protein JJU29_19690 [Verrucomicrobia bacterium]|nr:hypothetical protein [Verrucomicrobiota bacterium]MCH8510861.1 hypothetical protein [Kiritimatiellia bacterium]